MMKNNPNLKKIGTILKGDVLDPFHFMKQNPTLSLNIVKDEEGNFTDVYLNKTDNKYYIYCKESSFNRILNNEVDEKTIFKESPDHIRYKSLNEIELDKQKKIQEHKTQSKQTNKKTNKKTKTWPEELEKLKLGLQKLQPEYLNQIRFYSHKNKDLTTINFNTADLNVFAPKNTVPEVEKFVKEFSAPTNPYNLTNPPVQTIPVQEKPVVIIPPILQINYKNPEKQRIKDVLLKIKNLSNLKFYRIKDTTKLDYYKKKMKTNVQNLKTGETIVYYLKADWPIIRQFLKLIKNSYEFKKIQIPTKRFSFNKTEIWFSKDSKHSFEGVDYYIDLNGKKYFKLVLLNEKTKEKYIKVIDFIKDLSLNQVNQIKTIYSTKNDQNIQKIFNEIKTIIEK